MSRWNQLKFNNLKADLLHVIYPNHCLICDLETPHITSSICPICASELHYTNFEQFTVPTELDQLFWGRVHLRQTYAHLFFNTGNSTQKLLHALKYKDRSDLAFYMGQEIGKQLLPCDQWKDIDAIVPVPLHPKKAFIRGYNQAEKIADGIAQELDKPVVSSLLQRAVFTESQTKKGKLSRWDNMQDRFAGNVPSQLTFKHIAIVDDVVTTGATIETCIRLLQQNFPQTQISIIALAIAQ
jgi:ComF family protein